MSEPNEGSDSLTNTKIEPKTPNSSMPSYEPIPIIPNNLNIRPREALRSLSNRSNPEPSLQPEHITMEMAEKLEVYKVLVEERAHAIYNEFFPERTNQACLNSYVAGSFDIARKLYMKLGTDEALEQMEKVDLKACSDIRYGDARYTSMLQDPFTLPLTAG